MKKILIVSANYYESISKNLLIASKKILIENGFQIEMIKAPGVLEIPYLIKKYIKKYDGFIALGCVIKGKTPHFDLICNAVFKEIINLSTLYQKPITNGIITALNKKQALERSGLIKSKKSNKGLEAANAAVSIMKNGPKKI